MLFFFRRPTARRRARWWSVWLASWRKSGKRARGRRPLRRCSRPTRWRPASRMRQPRRRLSTSCSWQRGAERRSPASPRADFGGPRAHPPRTSRTPLAARGPLRRKVVFAERVHRTFTLKPRVNARRSRMWAEGRTSGSLLTACAIEIVSHREHGSAAHQAP